MKNSATYILMVVTVLIWGGTYVAGRTLNPAWNNVVTSMVRMAMAFMLLLFLCRASNVKLLNLNKRLIFIQILLGLCGVFMYTIFFHKGIQTVVGGRAAVIVNLNPIMMAIAAALFLNEKLTALKAIGVVMAAAGAVYVVSHGHISGLFSGKITLGDVYMLLAAVMWATFGILGKVAMRYGIQPLASITLSVFCGLVFLIPTAFLTGDIWQIAHYAVNDWLSIAYLGLLSTVGGFVFYYKIIKRVGAMRAGVICSAIPIAAIALTGLFIGEQATPSLVIGAIVTVGGIFLVNYSPKAKTA